MIPYGRHHIEEDDIEAVAAQMRSGWLTQGPKVGEFEDAVARYVGAKYAVAVSNGTAALHLACLAAGVSQGDRVITSPNSFVASANCAHYAGGVAEFVDIERDTLNMDPSGLRERCRQGPAPKAVIPVHFAGMPCDMAAVAEAAAAAGAAVIEDAAHALGARYRSGSRVGSCAHSDMAVFSFHPVKSIASGEGGMITTNREDLYRDLLRLRSHGINKLDDPFQHPQNASQDGKPNRWYYEMQELGFNFRLTDLQAALGLSQLGKIDRFLARRRELAARYRVALESRPAGLRAAQPGGWGESANHLFVIRAPFDTLPGGRTAYMQKLYDRGYVTQVHYIPIPMHPYYARRGCSMAALPEAAQYYREALSIPLFFGLTDAQQDRFVADAIECLA
jgi:perosamine synthetase